MVDVFLKSDCRALLRNRKVLLLGDSNFRALYKDIVWLLQHNTFIPEKSLRSKLQPSTNGDKLLAGTRLHAGRDYVEDRLYDSGPYWVKFRFITHCYESPAVRSVFRDIREKKSAPDIILMNSTVWDVSRWGPNGATLFKDSMCKLMRELRETLPPETLFVWVTCLPVSSKMVGGFLIQQLEFLKFVLRFELMEANKFAAELVAAYDYNVLDFHYFMRMQLVRRSKDGVHWEPSAIRFMTNMVLQHVALSLDLKLPQNLVTCVTNRAEELVDRTKQLAEFDEEKTIFPSVPKPFSFDEPDDCKVSGRHIQNGRQDKKNLHHNRATETTNHRYSRSHAAHKKPQPYVDESTRNEVLSYYSGYDNIQVRMSPNDEPCSSSNLGFLDNYHYNSHQMGSQLAFNTNYKSFDVDADTFHQQSVDYSYWDDQQLLGKAQTRPHRRHHRRFQQKPY